MSTMSHHLRRMKEYSLLRSSVNIRTPFSFPRHSIRALRFHSPQFLIGLAREMLHRSYSNEKSRLFLITLPREMLHRSYSNEDVAKSSALFQTLFFIQKEAIASQRMISHLFYNGPFMIPSYSTDFSDSTILIFFSGRCITKFTIKENTSVSNAAHT